MGDQLPLYPCRHVGCPALVRGGGWCPNHTKDKVAQDRAGRAPWADRPATQRRPYQDPAYRRLRARILRRDPICCICHHEDSTEVDHVVPISRGGTDHPDNLQGVCRGCHAVKSGREGAEARRQGGQEAQG